jgi:hypothetical protein
MKASAIANRKRHLGLAVAATGSWMLAVAAGPASACTSGDDGCPIVLKMDPGAVSVTTSGELTLKRPNSTFRFEARAEQTVLVHVRGPVTKSQLPLSGPIPVEAGGDFNQDQPFKLPASGVYSFTLYADMMAEGAFGPFELTLTIK